MSSKNQNPREGIETRMTSQALTWWDVLPSKNQNPREGIETYFDNDELRVHCYQDLQKTKIPARGLKLKGFIVPRDEKHAEWLQKTKIPARGLKRMTKYRMKRRQYILSSKNQNPREGIETVNQRLYGRNLPVGFKKPKSPRGD